MKGATSEIITDSVKRRAIMPTADSGAKSIRDTNASPEGRELSYAAPGHRQGHLRHDRTACGSCFRALAPKRILIVDENPNCFRGGRADGALAWAYGGRRVEHRVGSFALGRTEHAFDLAVVDYILPDGFGVALAEQFRRDRPNMPVFIATGMNKENVEIPSGVGFNPRR